MSLSAAMDAGPVSPSDSTLIWYRNRPHLAATLTNLAASELIATLPNIFVGTLTPEPQMTLMPPIVSLYKS